MTNTPVTAEEKMEIATTYVKKMRKLMAIRIILVCLVLSSAAIVKKHTEIGLLMLGTGGIGACILSLYSTAKLHCPFCGQRFGYLTSKFEILPRKCPHCNEQIKY